MNINVLNNNFNTIIFKTFDYPNNNIYIWNKIYFYEFDTKMNLLKIALYKDTELIKNDSFIITDKDELTRLKYMYDITFTYDDIDIFHLKNNTEIQNLLIIFINKGYKFISDLSDDELQSIKVITNIDISRKYNNYLLEDLLKICF